MTIILVSTSTSTTLFLIFWHDSLLGDWIKFKKVLYPFGSSLRFCFWMLARQRDSKTLVCIGAYVRSSCPARNAHREWRQQHTFQAWDWNLSLTWKFVVRGLQCTRCLPVTSGMLKTLGCSPEAAGCTVFSRHDKWHVAHGLYKCGFDLFWRVAGAQQCRYRAAAAKPSAGEMSYLIRGG